MPPHQHEMHMNVPRPPASHPPPPASLGSTDCPSQEPLTPESLGEQSPSAESPIIFRICMRPDDHTLEPVPSNPPSPRRRPPSGMDRAAVWEAVPREEHASIWDEAESDFWSRFSHDEHAHIGALEDKFARQSDRAKSHLDALTERCAQLTELQEKLTWRTAAADRDAALARAERDEAAAKLARLEEDYQRDRSATLNARHQLTVQMANFFRGKKGPKPLSSNDPADSRPPSRQLPGPGRPHPINSIESLINHDSSSGHGAANAQYAPRKHEQSPPKHLVAMESHRGATLQGGLGGQQQQQQQAAQDAAPLRSLMPWPAPSRPGYLPVNANGSTTTSGSIKTSTNGSNVNGGSVNYLSSPESSIQSWPRPLASTGEKQLTEITRQNLILRHNGTEYVYPECVAGVPLVKIDPSHAYWEPEWKEVRSLIEPQLAHWRAKYGEMAAQRPEEQKKDASLFQTQRQVNRGDAILKFLDTGGVSPYQLLGKRYTLLGKGSIVAYDTLFRLADTLADLEKLDMLDVTPLEWLRHRLWELIAEQGPAFSLARTMRRFYHDEKLAALRQKHGVKSKGRPAGSGVKPRPSAGAGAADDETATPPANKAPKRKRESDGDASVSTATRSPSGRREPERTLAPKGGLSGDTIIAQSGP